MITGSPLSIRLCLLGLLLGFVSPTMAGGKYKCWTNEDGIRECGQSVPPEYSQQRIEIFNNQGVVVDVEEPARTPEQLEAEKRAAELRKQEEQRETEKRRRDRVLLNTFTTERDLQIYYQDKRAAIQSQIDVTQVSNQSLDDKLSDLQKRAANLERRGQELPESLLKDMEQIKRQTAHNNEFIAGKEQELDALNRQFEMELERYRKLKSARSRQ